MGGETPNTAKLLPYRFFGPKSDLPVILAVMVLPAFCCADVTTLVKGYDKQTAMQLVFNLYIYIKNFPYPKFATCNDPRFSVLYSANFIAQNVVGII